MTLTLTLCFHPSTSTDVKLGRHQLPHQPRLEAITRVLGEVAESDLRYDNPNTCKLTPSKHILTAILFGLELRTIENHRANYPTPGPVTEQEEIRDWNANSEGIVLRVGNRRFARYKVGCLRSRYVV